MEAFKKLISLIFLSTGAIIGWGCFVLPGDMFISEAGLLGSSLALIVGAILMFPIAWCMGFLLIDGSFKSVGEAVGLKLGRIHAFLYYWFLCLTYLSIMALNINTIILLIREFLNFDMFAFDLYEVQGWQVKLNEIIFLYIIIFGLFVINKFKGNVLYSLQTFITSLLIFAVVYISLRTFGSSVSEELKTGKALDINIRGSLAILATAPWAFMGFDIISQVKEKINVKGYHVLWLMILSIISGLTIYLVVNLITFLGAGNEIYSDVNLNWAAGYAAKSVAGNSGYYFLSLALIAAVLAGINGFFIGLKNLIAQMKKNNVLPLSNQGIVRFEMYIFVIILITPWMGRPVLLWIVDMASIGACISFFYAGICGLTISRTRKEKILSLLGVFISCAFVVLLLFPVSPVFLSSPSILMLACWMIAGMLINKKIVLEQGLVSC